MPNTNVRENLLLIFWFIAIVTVLIALMLWLGKKQPVGVAALFVVTALPRMFVADFYQRNLLTNYVLKWRYGNWGLDCQ